MNFTQIVDYFNTLVQAPSEIHLSSPIGKSREGRDLHGFHFGSGPIKISLIAGCHADEPVGPLLLSKLINSLAGTTPEHPLLTEYQWHIIPHANPDGREVNNRWWRTEQEKVDLIDYFRYRVRELPGDDIEFGFPRHPEDSGAREENRAIYRWWKSFGTAFQLHASLHGMGFAAGPWYLVEAAWKDNIDFLKSECAAFVRTQGYRLHDVERLGEKGFFRLGQGFCTRPDSQNMRKFFLEQGDDASAALFYPSSMESMRSFGGNCLTIVSEMPLFLLPDVGIDIGPPDKAAETWKKRIAHWKTLVDSPEKIRQDAQHYGLHAMNVSDQMRFQWHFISSALEQSRLNTSDSQHS